MEIGITKDERVVGRRSGETDRRIRFHAKGNQRLGSGGWTTVLRARGGLLSRTSYLGEEVGRRLDVWTFGRVDESSRT